jgi:MFS family permease
MSTPQAGQEPLPALTKQRPFVLLWLARIASSVGYQMLTVSIGWQIYAITNSAFDLGLVGLIQFVPAVVLTLLIGHAADRYDRRVIVRTAQCVYACAALMLTVALIAGALSRDVLFAAVFMLGCARAFELPTSHSLMPALVPERLLPRAVAAWTSANQIAVISGPAAGGLIYALSPALVDVISLAFFLTAVALVTLVQTKRPPPPREPPTFTSVLAGFEYIRSRNKLLGIITLDLFVVLLGGATALLPVYARDILRTGPIGLGLLRSAPAAGALITTLALAHFPIQRHVGRTMFTVVAIFGVATMAFAVSTSFPFSLLALAVLGASDSVSVVIRFSLVQLETPDAMRGRVNAINYLFVGSSNTLGEFESGTLAAWLGTVASVLIGGFGSLLVAGLWMVLFPDLRRIDRFDQADKTNGET